MGLCRSRVFFITITLLTVACTGPRPPKLARLESPLSRVKLEGAITPSKIRELARALNSQGHYPGLQSAVTLAFESSLTGWANLLDRYWYRDADTSTGLIATLGDVSPQTLDQWIQSLQESILNHPGMVQTWKTVASHPKFVTVGTALAPILDLGLPTHTLEDGTTPNLRLQIASDFIRLNSTAENRITLAQILSALFSESFSSSFSKVLIHNVSTSLWQRLSQQISLLAIPPGDASDLEKLIDLLGLLNRPSQGAFIHVGKVSAKNVAIRRRLEDFFSTQTARVASSAVFFSVVQEFQREHWLDLGSRDLVKSQAAFQQLFSIVLRTLWPIMGVPSAGPNDILFERLASLNLNCLAISWWLQNLALTNLATLELLEINAYPEALSKAYWKVREFDFPVADFSDGQWRLSKVVEAQLRRLELNEFADELKLAIAQERLAGLTYSFSQWNSDLKGGLTYVLSTVDSVRPIAHAHQAATIFLQILGAEDSGSPVTWAQFETSNILVEALRWLRDWTSPESAIHSLRQLLVDGGIGRLSDEDRQLFVKIFDGSPFQAWVTQLLDCLPTTVRAFGFSNGHNSSLLELAHEILQGISNRELDRLASALGSLATLKVLNHREYPGFNRYFSDSHRLQMHLAWLSQWAMLNDLSIFSPALGTRSTVESLLEIFNDSFGSPPATPSTLAAIHATPLPLLDRPGRIWTRGFLESGGLKDLAIALQGWDRRRLLGLVTDLETALKGGDVGQALVLLRSVQDERFRLGIELLHQWLRNENMSKVLSILRLWLT